MRQNLFIIPNPNFNMKKEVLSIFLLVIFAASVYAAGNSEGGNTDSEIDYSCSADSDCVVVEKTCCGCVASSSSTAINDLLSSINKNSEGEWNENIRGQGCGGQFGCPDGLEMAQERKCNSYIPKCVNSRCKIVSENPTISEQARLAALEAKNRAKIEAREQYKKRLENFRKDYAAKNCENLDTKEERIKCRFILGENYTAPEGTIPEACRLAENQDRCKALYAATRTCFELEGKTKDACFKRALGIKKQLADEPREERNQKAREYIVTLLYNLEERVEKASEENKIDPEDGAEIIDKIVEIKGKVLNGATKEEIRTEMQSLKEMWRTALADAEDE